MQEGLGLAAELDGLGICDVEARIIDANVRAQVPGGERVLVGGIATEEQDRREAGGVVL